jgi:hypothetical protein
MHNKCVVLYPRGFIGFDTGLITDKTVGVDMDDWIKSIKLNKPVMAPVSPYKGIPEVDSLWNQYQTESKFITSFDFREQILKTALTAFGTLSFFDWCNLQNKNVYFTALHKRFLNDTFSFIEEGKRSISIMTWRSLLTMKASTSQDKEEMYLMNQFFRMDSQAFNRRSFRLSDNLVDWCRQENGFEDLLMTTHILFGSD